LTADFPLELGQEVIVREERGVYVIEPVRRTIDLTGIAGSMPALRPLTAEEREFEKRELPWHLPQMENWLE